MRQDGLSLSSRALDDDMLRPSTAQPAFRPGSINGADAEQASVEPCLCSSLNQSERKQGKGFVRERKKDKKFNERGSGVRLGSHHLFGYLDERTQVRERFKYGRVFRDSLKRKIN